MFTVALTKIISLDYRSKVPSHSLMGLIITVMDLNLFYWPILISRKQ